MTIRLDPKRYIPYRKHDIVEMCLSRNELDAAGAERFRMFSHQLGSVFHYEYHALQEQLKNAYAPVNPDTDTRKVELDRPGSEPRFIDLLESLLDKANYEKVSDTDLEECKEAILAYYFLFVSNNPLTKNELDSVIEAWFAERWQTRLGFEIDDALQKLMRLQLVEPSDGKYSAVQMESAVRRLDALWDSYFSAA